MAEYSHKPRKFLLKGVDLSRPVDLLEIGSYVLVRNVRGYTDGTVTTRPGAAALAAALAGGAVHSLKRLNDEIGPTLSTPTQSYARMAGAGTKLYSDNSTHNAFTEIATGLSGNPVTWIPIRPEQSPQPWMYIHDTAKLLRAKASAAGDVTKSYQWGIAPPTQPLSIALGSPVIKTIDDMEAATFGGWAASAGAFTNPDRAAAIVISNILFDTGATGWACVNPASIGEIREGMDLTTSASAETVKVDSVYKAITTTTIGSIRYDSGTTGLCTIQLAAPTAELVMNSMVRIAAAENVRVLSVTYGPDGIPSFRCSTTATRSAGDAVAGLASFRAYFANTHAAAETLSGKMLQVVTAGTGITTLTRTVALDLSTFGTRPVLPSDIMVLSLNTDNVANISEIQLQLDVDASTNDFTKNYYLKAISPADFTPVVQQTLPQLTVQQRVIQRDEVRASQSLAQKLNMLSMDSNEMAILPGDVIDTGVIADPTPSVDQTATGTSQWSVIKIPISELLAGRVGSDTSRGLKDVAKIRISINVATGTPTVQVDDWYITGGFGADSVLPNSTENAASPYFWTYRYRDGRTGDKSPWAPLNRSGFQTSRNRLVLTPTVSTDAQVTKIDIARIGGTLNEFRIIGTMPNSGTFNDDFPDDVAAAGQAVDVQDVLNLAQPFPVLDIPRTGTCDVKGTEVIWVSGDKFNVAAMKDSQILINNVPYNLYTNPDTDQHLTLLQNAGTQTAVSFFIPDAFLQGQTLDAVFGPFAPPNGPLVIFGVKRGTLYWTTGNDPSLSRTNNQKEITGGSEVLMNGCLYDSRPYMLSNERMFEIISDGQGGYEEREVANSKGLWAPWGLCVGINRIYVVCEDGIYESEGGQFVKISQDLGPLLPHDGVPGVTVNGILPPDFAQTASHKLEYGDNKLKWSFLDTGGTYRTWIYDTFKKGWESLDTYAFEGVIHYHEEAESVHSELIGGKDGIVYQVGGTLDGAVAITSALKTGCEDCGESRAQKQFGDVQLDCNTGAVDLTVRVLTNNLVTTSATETINNALRTYELLNIDNGLGVTARNISLDMEWTGYVVLYEWNPSYIPRSDLATERTTDWFAPNGGQACWLQGVKIDIDTFGVAKSFQVLGDDDALIATLSIDHDGRVIEPFTWEPAFVHLVRLLPVGETTDFLMYSEPVWVSEPEPELALLWQTQPTTHDFQGFGHVYRAQIAHRSTADVTMTVTIDGVDYEYTIPNSNGEYEKTYVTLQAIKGKWFAYRFESTEGVRVYKRDCVVELKAWADVAAYQSGTPFGSLSRISGADI